MAPRPSCITLPSTGPAAACDPSRRASFLHTRTVHLLSFCAHLRHPSSIVAHSLSAPGLESAFLHVLPNHSSKFADSLCSISSLYLEVGEERRAADEYMQRSAQETGCATEDYERRALLFERGGEMVASSKLKRERVIMELELLQGEILEGDEGRTAADYFQRAQIFSKSAEIFANLVSDEPL